MVNSFHEMAEVARKTFIGAWDQKPEHRNALMLVRDHFKFNSFTVAMIHFITNDNLDDAVTKIMRECGMKKMQAKTLLTSAIEHGPKIWLQNFDFLHSKGVVSVGGRCFILPPELRKNTPYTTAFQQLAPDVRKIAEEALALVVKHGKKDTGFSYGPVTQQYLVAQLMNEGSEKDFRITALSIDKVLTAHNNQLTNSAQAVRHIAKEIGVDLVGLNIVLREGRAVEPRPADKKPVSKPILPSINTNANPRFLAAANDTDGAAARKELRQSLSQLIGQNGITNVQAQLYLYLSNMADGYVPTHEDASRKFGISVKSIPGIVENIERALDKIEPPSLPALAIKR